MMTRFTRWMVPFALTVLVVFAMAGCSASASFTPNTLNDLANADEDLYLYGVEKSGSSWYAKVLEEYAESPTDGFLYLPLAEDVYAEFQDPECVGAWSPDQYFSADDIASGCKEGKVMEGAECSYIAEDGVITEMYEENYYDGVDVTGQAVE